MDNILADFYLDKSGRFLVRHHYSEATFFSEEHTEQMRTNGTEPIVTPPNSRFVLWCPFCDEWQVKDSMIARKRLGLHLSDKHPDEVRFRKGVEPPPVEEWQKA